MYSNPFQVDLKTIIGSSRILGHWLEDRSTIRKAQDEELLKFLQNGTGTKLRDASQRGLFAVAPMDILVSENAGRKNFHIIEINGTGIGGLTNISEHAVGCILADLQEMAEGLPSADPVILVASSGFETATQPRQNKLIFEKILYAEAIRRGLAKKHDDILITSMIQLRDDPRPYWANKPTIVLGYMKEFLADLRLVDGKVLLFDRPLSVAVNDRFALNILQHFDGKVDVSSFHAMNGCYLPGADKGVAYDLLNEYVQQFPGPHMPSQVFFRRAFSREELVDVVLDWLSHDRKTVIKPQGTGLGHGIEFFLDPNESPERVTARIDHSLQLTEAYYGIRGGALPYTICEFIDTCMVGQANHPLKGHKYEMRIVVYRDEMELKAFPSIVKISSEVYNPLAPSHLSLINNITTSAMATGTAGVEHMLPLCNRQTLALLDISPEDLRQACACATGFLRYVLDRVQEDPERFTGEGSSKLAATASY